MKEILTIISGIIILLSCQNKQEGTPENPIEMEGDNIITSHTDLYVSQGENEKRPSQNQIDSLTKEMDRLLERQLLTKYFYPNMSRCGGELYGHYKDSKLLIIDATYQAELGYSSRKYYWHNGGIVKINYREHFAEWAKYEVKYPSNQFEWEPSKMTYTDTIYQITLGNEYQMQTMADGKVISEKTDSNLINKLVNCGFEMRNEIENEKRKEE